MIDVIEKEFSIYSIYYDIASIPINIDIKKILEDNITSNIHNKPLFLIRFLKRNDIFPKLFDNILNENKIRMGALTYPSIIWNYENMDIIHDTARIINNWFKIIASKKPIIDNIIFVTSSYLEVIENIGKEKYIYLVSNSEMINKYSNANVINFEKYIINDMALINENIKIYDKYNWKDGNKNNVLDEQVIYFLNMFAKALNNRNANYTCLRYCNDIKNIEWTERNEAIEQYILYYDYTK